jgi:hypothetical protein
MAYSDIPNSFGNVGPYDVGFVMSAYYEIRHHRAPQYFEHFYEKKRYYSLLLFGTRY